MYVHCFVLTCVGLPNADDMQEQDRLLSGPFELCTPNSEPRLGDLWQVVTLLMCSRVTDEQ